MNNKLIERIDGFFIHTPDWATKLVELLGDCKTEIYKLQAELDETKEASLGVIELQKAEIKRFEKAREYVSLSNQELYDLYCLRNPDENYRLVLSADVHDSFWESERQVEAEVIKRANLIVKEKE